MYYKGNFLFSLCLSGRKRDNGIKREKEALEKKRQKEKREKCSYWENMDTRRNLRIFFVFVFVSWSNLFSHFWEGRWSPGKLDGLSKDPELHIGRDSGKTLSYFELCSAFQEIRDIFFCFLSTPLYTYSLPNLYFHFL